jgi:hypothetical protein
MDITVSNVVREDKEDVGPVFGRRELLLMVIAAGGDTGGGGSPGQSGREVFQSVMHMLGVWEFFCKYSELLPF